MNYCTQCKYYVGSTRRDVELCKSPKCVNPVNGCALPIRVARMDMCNRDGEPRFFKRNKL